MRIKVMSCLIIVILLLLGCSTSQPEYKAEENHLIDTFFTGRQNKSNVLEFLHGNLRIVTDSTLDGIKPETDPKDLNDSEKRERLEVTYSNIKVEVKGAKYFITGDDDFSMELKRVGERIISDEDGDEYVSDLYFDND